MIESECGTKYKVDLNYANNNDARIIAYRFVRHGACVLDVGCACGDFGTILAFAKSCTVYGLDFDSASISQAVSTGAYKYLEQVDLNTYDVGSHVEWNGLFDCITFLDVLEHLVAPRECLVKLLKLLKPDGEVVISLPNIAFGDIKLGLMNDEFSYSATGILDNTHLRFFTYKSIAVFLADTGLIVTDVDFKLSGLDSKLRDEADNVLVARISENPHSFVYQYVMKCNRSNLSAVDLTATNMAKLDVVLKDIRPRLLLLGAKQMLAGVLPAGSFLRRVLRDAVACFVKRVVRT